MAASSRLCTAAKKPAKAGTSRRSLLANGLWSNGLPIQAKFCGATFTPRVPRERAPNALTNMYKCRDGRWLTLSLLEEERQWPVLVRAIDEPSLADDPRFDTTAGAASARARTRHHLRSHLSRARFRANGARSSTQSGLVFGFVATLDDVVADQQARDNGYILPDRRSRGRNSGQPDLCRRLGEVSATARAGYR